ncbi:MAG: phytanoyl-CoA dioxygenase family protein [Terracidiphilus sp.]|jgi:hypothetical protein
MSQIRELLLKSGICQLTPLYSGEELAAFNAAINPLLESRVAERRAYVHVEELLELGVFGMVLSEKMKAILFSIVPDPVLYHCHVYEIAANDARPHIFGDSLAGWHRDMDCNYVAGDPTHVSIFVYLTNVGPEDGAFEFVPGVPPTKWLHNGAPYSIVQGPAGYSFAWHRRFYHRASPNRGPVRRRLLKISIQRNAFPSAHLGNEHFKKLLSQVPAGDLATDLLLGRYQGKKAPVVAEFPIPDVTPVPANSTLKLSSVELTKAQLREKAHGLKSKLRGDPYAQALAVYD